MLESLLPFDLTYIRCRIHTNKTFLLETSVTGAMSDLDFEALEAYATQS